MNMTKQRLFPGHLQQPETTYGPEDYATDGAVQRLFDLGNDAAAMAVIEEHGEYLGGIDTMDPMDILIALEGDDEDL